MRRPGRDTLLFLLSTITMILSYGMLFCLVKM